MEPNGLPKADCLPLRLLSCFARSAPNTCCADGDVTPVMAGVPPPHVTLGALPAYAWLSQ